MPQGGLMVTVPRLAGFVSAGFAATLLFSARPVAQTQSPAAPTFTKDVLPILQRSCQNCHRPGTPAPMSLLTYADVRPWARSMKTKVTNREMPPWHIDRSIGEYANDVSLSDQEVATIAAWVDRGAPEGNRADAPPAKVFPPSTEWTYGEPDLVVRMAKGFKIPASGPDFIPEEHVDPGLTEDRYVKWVQIIPDAWRAVHHAHVYVDLPEGVDREGLGLNMGSNVGNSMDLKIGRASCR